jgi:hypothetical protein
MKPVLIWTALWFVVATALAQDRAEDFRIFEGQLYNVRRSVKWTCLAADYGRFAMTLTVRKIMEDGSLYCTQETEGMNPGGGDFYKGVSARLILKNYPAQDPHIGLWIRDCYAIRLPAKPGDTVNTYDYGLPNTPENRKTLSQATNSIAVVTNTASKVPQKTNSAAHQ